MGSDDRSGRGSWEAMGRRRKRPGDLVPGDMIEFEGKRFEVCGQPFLGRSGASVFDSFYLFWRAPIRQLDGRIAYATWPDGESAIVAADAA